MPCHSMLTRRATESEMPRESIGWPSGTDWLSEPARRFDLALSLNAAETVLPCEYKSWYFLPRDPPYPKSNITVAKRGTKHLIDKPNLGQPIPPDCC